MDLKNKIVEKFFIPEHDLSILWQLYWLKGVVYDSQIHDCSLNVKPHFHSFLEIHMLFDGELEYLIDDRKITVHGGEFILISPKTTHQLVRYSAKFQKITIAFSFQLEDEDFPDLNFELFQKMPYFIGENTSALTAPLIYILYELNHAWKESPMVVRMQLNSFLLTLFHTVQKSLHDNPSFSDHEDLNPNDEMIYRSVVQYLRTHVSQMVGVDETAESLLISVRQINRVLKRSHATCFSKLRDEIKCQVARELLFGNLSLEKVGEELDFSCVYSFNRFFKRVEGMTPGKFREALRCSNCK